MEGTITITANGKDAKLGMLIVKGYLMNRYTDRDKFPSGVELNSVDYDKLQIRCNNQNVFDHIKYALEDVADIVNKEISVVRLYCQIVKVEMDEE